MVLVLSNAMTYIETFDIQTRPNAFCLAPLGCDAAAGGDYCARLYWTNCRLNGACCDCAAKSRDDGLGARRRDLNEPGL